MEIRYFRTAWDDLRQSPGWFGKIVLLALLNLIPIFGQIVSLGYLYGWAREIAWNVHEPLPEHIFGNEDGKLYRRYRLRTCDPTRFVETLDYDIECPHCHDQLRLCGMAVDAMTHGLYRCKRCDDEAERRR